MNTEIEAKWLAINSADLRRALQQAGAILVFPERLMTRCNFDYPDKRLERIGGWVRVRNEVDKITLSYKQLNDRTVYGTKEVNVVVNDFQSTCKLLEPIGLEQHSFQETMRESWRFGDTEIEIDTWPWIPTFVEIEAKSEGQPFRVAKKLGLSRSEALHSSVEIAYQAVYDMSESEVDGWKEIRFVDTPHWLQKKG